MESFSGSCGEGDCGDAGQCQGVVAVLGFRNGRDGLEACEGRWGPGCVAQYVPSPVLIVAVIRLRNPREAATPRGRLRMAQHAQCCSGASTPVYTVDDVVVSVEVEGESSNASRRRLSPSRCPQIAWVGRPLSRQRANLGTVQLRVSALGLVRTMDLEFPTVTCGTKSFDQMHTLRCVLISSQVYDLVM